MLPGAALLIKLIKLFGQESQPKTHTHIIAQLYRIWASDAHILRSANKL